MCMGYTTQFERHTTVAGYSEYAKTAGHDLDKNVLYSNSSLREVACSSVFLIHTTFSLAAQADVA